MPEDLIWVFLISEGSLFRPVADMYLEPNLNPAGIIPLDSVVREVTEELAERPGGVSSLFNEGSDVLMAV